MIIISKLYHVTLNNPQKKMQVTVSKNFDDVLNTYTVKKGDTLYKIARKHLLRNGINPTNMHIQKLIKKLVEINNIKNPNKIFIGQVLNFVDIQANIKKELDFVMPVKGHITSKFGMRIDPFTKEMRFHSGIDIGAPVGTPIHAAKGGKVIYAGKERGYGNIVIIKHLDNVITKYAHASKLLVKKGDFVKQGDVIALVGSTGRSTGPHLHFEVRLHNKAVNPLKYLSYEFQG